MNNDEFDTIRAGEACFSLLEYIRYPVSIRDANGNFLWVNDSFLKFFNVQRENVINRPGEDVLPRDIAIKALEAERKIIKKRCSLTIRLETKEYRRVVYKTPIFSDDNQVIAIITMVVDSTLERDPENQLNSIREFYSSLVANMGEALFYLNNKGDFDYVNGTALEFLSECGYHGPLNFHSWSKFFPNRYDKNGNKIQLNNTIYHRALRGEIVLNDEVTLERKDGRRMVYFGSAVPYKSKIEGSILGVIITINNITESIKLRDVLEEKTRIAEKRNQDLQHFARSAAHDLSEPLRNISLSATFISEKIKSQDYHGIEELADRLLKTALYGSSLVKNLIDYHAAYQERRVDLVSLVEVVGQTITILNNIIEEAGAKIIIQKLPVVLGNFQQLQVVFQNIISNAIRYKGEQTTLEIMIGAKKKGDFWIVSVKDNGLGIKKEFKEEIFIPFKRLQAIDENSRSSGLGLSICRQIIEQHGGKIWLDTRYTNGACFKFTLKGAPLESPTEENK